jgi:hypothetical protein
VRGKGNKRVGHGVGYYSITRKITHISQTCGESSNSSATYTKPGSQMRSGLRFPCEHSQMQAWGPEEAGLVLSRSNSRTGNQHELGLDSGNGLRNVFKSTWREKCYFLRRLMALNCLADSQSPFHLLVIRCSKSHPGSPFCTLAS